MSDNKLVNGLYYKEKRENAPDFVVCGLSAKREQLIEFLQSETDEWVNMDVLLSKEAKKPYIVVNNWKPEEKKEDVINNAITENNVDSDDLPF